MFSFYLRLLEKLNVVLGDGIIHHILIGSTENGINLIESLGLLTTGVYVPIGMILPYVFSFYVVLSILEDSGYLPRLAALIDNFMHRLGMHGIAVVPIMLGFGCNVPGAYATRILETRRQRFIAITLIAIAVPCMSQMAMLFGLLGGFGLKGLGIVFLTLFIVWLIIGKILNKLMKGVVPETFMEITPYRIPNFKTFYKKLFMRLKGFMFEAVPYVFLGVIIINILYFTGIIDFVGNLASPIVEGLLGLPKEAVGTLIIGFLRKDVAVGMLVPLGLTMKQMIIASVVLTMYFPCIATFSVIYKELGLVDTFKSVGVMVISTLITGTVLNFVL